MFAMSFMFMCCRVQPRHTDDEPVRVMVVDDAVASKV